MIQFHPRDEEWEEKIKKQLISALADYEIRSVNLGEELEWDNAGEYYVGFSRVSLTIRLSYAKWKEKMGIEW